MLTLTPGSSCDVCAEEYGPHCLPNSIPCGHVLCASCCTTIAEKTAPRLSPACPFCRENFSPDAVRLIRLDFNTSGWTTPRRLPNMDANPPDFASDAWNKRLMMADGCSRSRLDARRLEAKVAKVAAKKCSVEEVTHLHKELQEWLMSDPKDDDDSRSQVSALTLSAALLRAILMNHVAHSEASRLAKSVEANLKTKLDDIDLMNSKLDAELKRQRHAYSQKAQECQNLRQELGRLKIVPTTPPAPLPQSSTLEMRHQSPSPPPMPPVPSAYTSSASSAARLGSTHTRSASLFSRPTTPAANLARAQTPGPVSPPRSYTPAPPRSQTPGPTRPNSLSFASANAARLERSPSRAQTPAPPSRASTMTPTPTRHVSMTAASVPLRARTPAPVQTTAPLPRARRLSHPSPPPLAARSLSEEKYEAQALHQRWLPTAAAYDDKVKYNVARPASRVGQYTFRGYHLEEEDD